MRGYCDLQRYKRAVSDLNRLIEKSTQSGGPVRLSLCNYQDIELSAVRATDLLRAAEEYEKNPFHEYFSKRNFPCHGTFLAGCGQHSFELPESGADGVFDYWFYQGEDLGHVRIVLGGSLITSWVRRPGWKAPFSGLVGQIMDGPGEQALLSLAGVREDNRRRRFSYDPFPMPDYFAPGPIIPYSASCGCYWNRCAFCPEKAEGVRYESVSPEAAAREARELCSGHTRR